MAKKKKQSLTQRIAALINRVGEKPEPSFGDIKSELVECLGLAETLENDAVIRDLEEQVTVLEAALEKSNLENSNLQTELQSLKTEVDGFRAERKKKEEERRRKEMPEIQFKILQRLPSENEGDGQTLKAISRRANIEALEAEIHLHWLEKSGFAKRRYFASADDSRIAAWYRTAPGNELILAKRLAGEEQTSQRKYPDLPNIEEGMLAMMIGEKEGVREESIHESLERVGVTITLEKVEYILRASLQKKGFADFDSEEGTYGMGNTWFITDRGTEYFFERDKL